MNKENKLDGIRISINYEKGCGATNVDHGKNLEDVVWWMIDSQKYPNPPNL